MAIQDVIKRLIYQFTSTGADQVAADLGKVNAEQEKLAVNSQQTTQASLDLEKSFDNLERRFDSTIRAQQDYAKVQAQVNAAVAQHPELQERANNVLDLAKAKFDRAAEGADAYSKLLAKGRESLAGFAAEGGPVGALLGSFGPWGIAAAAGIGLVAKAFNYVKEQADKMGESSAKLKDFSDNTDLTVTQIRGLTEAGAGVGLAADQVGSAMEKFTVNLGAAREGSGALYDGLRRIDSGLADDVAASASTAQAFDAVIKAINATTDATTKLNIAKAAFGKGGASMAGVADIVGNAGGLNAYSDAAVKASGVSTEMIDQVAQLSKQLKQLQSDNELLKQSFASVGALQAEIDAATRVRDALLAAKKAKDDWVAGGSISINWDTQFPSLQIKTQADALGANTAARNDNTAATKIGTEADAAWEAALVADTSATQANTAAKDANTAAWQRTASQEATNVAALGSAATSTEKLQAKVDALTASYAAGKIPVDVYNRAVQGVTNDAGAAEQKQKDLANGVSHTASAMDDATSSVDHTAGAMNTAAGSASSLSSGFDDIASSAESAAGSVSTLGSALAGIYAKGNDPFASLLGDQSGGGGGGDGASVQPTIWTPKGYQTANTYMGYAIAAAQQAGTLGGPPPATGSALVDQYLAQGGVDYALSKLMYGQGSAAPDYSSISSLYDLKNQQTTDKGMQAANLQQELAWMKSQPETLARDQSISQLQSSIDSLTKSTDSLNATNQELLSPYYTQDPRTSHIGFRSQGMAAGGYIDVPGGSSANDNMLLTMPVASGERIYVDPMTGARGGGGTVVNLSISSPVIVQAGANTDQIGRTLYQSNQSLAKQIRAAMP